MEVSTGKTENKNVELIVSNTYLSAFYEIIDSIKEQSKDKFKNIILVVPDKFSLNAEQIFMERLETDSVFNVWLTTLSRLINKVVEESGNTLPVLSKNSGTMLVSKIILNNKDKLSTYKKITNNYSFAESMFNVINLLKSSGVKPFELKENFDNSTFGFKLKDIYLIYSEYEKALAGKTDSITRIEIFDSLLKQSEYIKNSDIYFAMFDSFTNVQINSLANLAKNCNSFCVSLCANTKQNNANIYDNILFQKIKNTFDDLHIDYKIKNILAKQNKRNDFLTQNFLSYNPKQKFETDDIKLLECDSVEQEVKYVASKIKYLVLEENYKFDDINIAVNGLEDYSLEIKTTFDEFDLPFYVDESRTMLDHYFCGVLFKISDFICGEKTISNAIDIVKSPLFLIEYSKKCDFENYCKKYNIFGDTLYTKFDICGDEIASSAEEVRSIVFDAIKTFENNIKNAKTAKEYSLVLQDYISQIDAKVAIENNIYLQTDVICKRIDSEVLDKFLNIINEVLELVADDEFDAKMYFDMLKSCLKGTNLLTAPIRCNSVFVGDASQSTYYPRKILFVLGSTEARMPAYQSDCGDITDTEIEIFRSSNKITPSIKELNKREKFKLFNLVVMPSDRLEICYSTMINGQIQQKSEFVTALQNIITTKDSPSLTVDRYAMEELKIFESKNKNLPAYFVGTTMNCVKLSNKKTTLGYLLSNQIDDILQYAKAKFEDRDRFVLKDAKQYLFNNNKTSISQIEKYFSCPFYQFVEKAISPKEREDTTLKPMLVGNILHKVAQLFVDEMISNNFALENVEALAQNCFDKILNLKEYENMAKTTYDICILKDEAIRFCNAIYHQIEVSDFKPLATEKKFDWKLSNELNISGFIDRVDQYNNYLRIIDYKTGSQEFDYSEIYYGLKLQLIAYSKIIADIENKESVCTAYMPVRNSFNKVGKSEFETYKLDGICLNDEGIMAHLDKNLLDGQKSDVIKTSKNYCLDREQIKNIFDYSFKIINLAINEMLDGYIEPKPSFVNDRHYSCQYCKYKALCHHIMERDGFRKIEKKDKTSFGRENE